MPASETRTGQEKNHSTTDGWKPFSWTEVKKRERVGERTGRGVHARCYSVEILWVTLGENISLPGVHLEEDILPLQGQKCHQEKLNKPSNSRGQRHAQKVEMVPVFCCVST